MPKRGRTPWKTSKHSEEIFPAGWRGHLLLQYTTKAFPTMDNIVLSPLRDIIVEQSFPSGQEEQYVIMLKIIPSPTAPGSPYNKLSTLYKHTKVYNTINAKSH